MERPPFTAVKYSGGGVTLMQLALTDAHRPAVCRDDAERRCSGPIGMTNSAYEQPLSPERDRNAARAHSGRGRAMDAKWHVYPELAAAGLWTTPTRSGAVRDRDPEDRCSASRTACCRSATRAGDAGARSASATSPSASAIAKMGEGWYFGHGGSQLGLPVRSAGARPRDTASRS